MPLRGARVGWRRMQPSSLSLKPWQGWLKSTHMRGVCSCSCRRPQQVPLLKMWHRNMPKLARLSWNVAHMCASTLQNSSNVWQP
eukprot:1841733-Karenia_brevis.AAC.1